MSRRIANLLNESEAAVTNAISQLERKNGHPGHDARHIADIHQQVRQKLKDLNLDPDDTTANELYQALLVKYEADSQKLDQHYGVNDQELAKKLEVISGLVNSIGQMPRLWALKNSEAKKILRLLPPKQTMKYLKYRSVESLIKRQNICEIFLAAQLLESGSWHKQHQRLVSKLDNTAFELRAIKFMAFDAKKWGGIDAGSYMVAADDVAAITLWPSIHASRASLLSLMLILAAELETYDDQINIKCLINDQSLIGWWIGTDHLIADLPEGQVSLNLRDVAANSREGHGFASRLLDKGRLNYWYQLVNRYENKLDVEGMFDMSAISHVKQIKFKVPQPAFEYEFAEDL